MNTFNDNFHYAEIHGVMASEVLVFWTKTWIRVNLTGKEELILVVCMLLISLMKKKDTIQVIFCITSTAFNTQVRFLLASLHFYLAVVRKRSSVIGTNVDDSEKTADFLLICC